MKNAPAPPVPADCDLRGLDYMPLFGNHLFGSEFNAGATDSEWRAAVTLWWAAWNQVPAGSLPDDDVALCRLADLGRDVKAWKKLRARALHGFKPCSDGRLYHSFIVKQALVAWDKRVKERERKAKWRAEKDAKKPGQDADVPRDRTGTETGTGTGTERGQDADVPADGNGRDGTGRDDEKKKTRSSSAEAVAREDLPPDPWPPDAQPTQAGLACRAMKAAGISDPNPGHPDLLALLDAGATHDELVGAARDAVGRGKGFAYALGTAVRRRQEAAEKAQAMHRGPMPAANDRKARQLETAALMTGAVRANPKPLEAIDVDARVVPARALG